MTNKKTLYIISAVIIVAAAVVIWLVLDLSFSSFKKSGVFTPKAEDKPRVIEEKLEIPDTQKITGGEGRFVEPSGVDVPLMPKTEGEKVIVSKAVLTVKGSYNLAAPEAEKWSADAKLVFVKSLGAVTLDGKSSQWQLAFSSKSKARGYEIIIQADQIASSKEIISSAQGADLPQDWYDSSGAVKSLQNLPQFADATLSSISFYYNLDGKSWEYALATSRGVTAMTVK